MNKTLYRDEYHKKIGGVCAGLAEYFDMDVTIVRLLFVLTVIIMGVGVVPYIVLWIVLPKRPYPYNNFGNPTVDYTVPPQQPGSTFTTPPPADAYSSNPYGGNPFAGSPFTNDPVPPVRQKSNAGIIVGAVLIILGAAILIDNYDLIPDFDFERLWPAILVIIGAALLISGPARKNTVDSDWQKPVDTDGATEAATPANEAPKAE